MGSKSPSAPPPPAPPATERQTEVVDAKRQTAQDARKRKGQLSTLLAGETGNQRNETQTAARKTLLGASMFR